MPSTPASERASVSIEAGKPTFSVTYELHRIGRGVVLRSFAALSNLQYALLSSLLLVPKVAAEYPLLSSPKPSYDVFVASTSNDTQVQADINNFLTIDLRFYNSWRHRAHEIRKTGNSGFCVGNLSIALADLGSVYAVGSSGASSLLTMIPTAGALIGAPARELWVLYKLMPVAGLLSMLLSLGGNIVPMDVSDYEKLDAFSYSGMVATADHIATSVIEKQTGETEAEHFASRVYARAMEDYVPRRSGHIWIGIGLQLLWLSGILTACWFLESGAVVTWWCTNPSWMYFWFAIVAGSSLLDNLAGAPFSHQWTIRVSKSPEIEIDEDAPWVVSESRGRNDSADWTSTPPTPEWSRSRVGSTTDQNNLSTSPLPFATYQRIPRKPVPVVSYHEVRPTPSGSDILTALERGYKTVGGISIDRSTPWSASKDAFCVVISVRGVSSSRAFLRMFSKLISIGVYAIGTALFASSTLVTSLIAILTTTIIICAGIFGRITSLWLASEIMRNRPILHRVVQTREDAGRYMEAILARQGMVCEVLNHIVVDGRCVKRFGKRLRLNVLVGVLANPYDLNKLAIN